jgi:hypothetical protein
MKVRFRLGVRSYSGSRREEDLTFMSFRNGDVPIVRRWVYPRITENNQLQGEKMRAAARLWRLVNLDFVKALRDYADSYNMERRPTDRLLIHGYNIFTRGVLKANLPIVSIQDLVDILGMTINEWIQQRYLDPVQRRLPSFDTPIII